MSGKHFSEKKKKKKGSAYLLTWSVKQNSLSGAEHMVKETCKEEKKLHYNLFVSPIFLMKNLVRSGYSYIESASSKIILNEKPLKI